MRVCIYACACRYKSYTYSNKTYAYKLYFTLCCNKDLWNEGMIRVNFRNLI